MKGNLIFDITIKLMKKLGLLFLVIAIALTACKGKAKVSLSSEGPIELEDFISSFELVKPTIEFNDSFLQKTESDSLRISFTVFTQFVPDSVFSKIIGTKVKPKIYALKRIEFEKQEIYLFVKVIYGDKKLILLLCFDSKNNYLASFPLLILDNNPNTKQVSSVDKRFSIFKTTYLKKSEETIGEGREVFVFSADAKQFILIMTDDLDDKIKDIINPIDTLERKNKFAADYSNDKMNFVSIRDGTKPNTINIFIHIEKNGKECIGELKGVATFTNSRTAVFRHPGNPCVLQLKFNPYSVSLKELEACGSQRGVKCSFDGYFPRKKK